MNASLDPVFDAVLVPALELLAERTGRKVSALRDNYERRAYELLGADFEHAGRVTLSARSLADLLVPSGSRSVPVTRLHGDNEQRRRQNRGVDRLEPAVFARCLAAARQALETESDR